MTKPDIIQSAGETEFVGFSPANPAPAGLRALSGDWFGSAGPVDANEISGEGQGTSVPDSFRSVVLAVDDTEEGLAHIQQALGESDIDLILARSGAEALALISDERIALVLLDVSMPEMDGFQVARQIRARLGETAPPVIFVTALRSSNELVLGAYEAGSVDFLQKPVNASILRSKVEIFSALHQKRKREETRLRRLATMQHSLVARRSAAERAARDVSFELAELQHRNRELAQRNHELDSFAHVISHDLRQPLQSILDYLELIAETEECGQNPNISRWIHSSRKLGQNMQALISGVLDYATIGTRSMSFRLADGNAVLQDALENLLALIRQEDALVSYDPLPKILGSDAFLTRLFQNLINNSIKYRRDVQPCVRITCERQEAKRAWLIRVSDNGRGIPREALGSIFDMFTRVGETKRVAGSGVGLAICKKIAELHGAQIWAESEVGKGTDMCMLFPNFDDKFV